MFLHAPSGAGSPRSSRTVRRKTTREQTEGAAENVSALYGMVLEPGKRARWPKTRRRGSNPTQGPMFLWRA